MKEGLDFFRENIKWNKNPEDYFRALMHIMSLGEDRGLLLVLVSGGGTPLGYLAAVDTSSIFTGSQMTVYALYSNKKCSTTFVELCAEVEQWAKLKGFKEVVACSYRFSRAALRWFTGKLKFKREFIVFTKQI